MQQFSHCHDIAVLTPYSVMNRRKEIERDRDEQEWADITARQALTREGPLGEGAAVKPRLSLEEELEVGFTPACPTQ